MKAAPAERVHQQRVRGRNGASLKHFRRVFRTKPMVLSHSPAREAGAVPSELRDLNPGFRPRGRREPGVNFYFVCHNNLPAVATKFTGTISRNQDGRAPAGNFDAFEPSFEPDSLWTGKTAAEPTHKRSSPPTAPLFKFSLKTAPTRSAPSRVIRTGQLYSPVFLDFPIRKAMHRD